MADIPVNESTATITVIATSNGQTVFAFDYLVYESASVRAIFEDVSAGTTQDLVDVVDFTVAGLGVPTGGTITLVSLGPSVVIGDRMTIYRDTVIERPADFQPSGDYFADTVNREEDTEFMIMQELARDNTRALRFPLGDPTSGVLPSISARAEKALAFDAAGAILMIDNMGLLTASYPERSGAVDAIAGGLSVSNGSLLAAGGFLYVADDTATAIPDMPGWLPFGDAASLNHWGIVFADRAAAATNGAAINTAIAYCGLVGLMLVFGSGVIFNSVPIIQDVRCHIVGGAVGEWFKFNTSTPRRADCEIMMVGTGPKNETVYGVSSQHNWGAGRLNPSSRVGTHNDAEYRLLSFVEDNTLATGRTLKAFSAAWKMTFAASGSVIEGVRVLPDYGGTEGYDGYFDAFGNTVGVTSYPLTDGDWDVGMYQDNARTVRLDRLQFVGQWRMAGLLFISHAVADPAAAYNNYYDDCIFSGYHGVEIRGADGAPVEANTTTTVDMPWADDHPFGADGFNDVNLGTDAWPTSTVYTFTGMTKVTGGAHDILRLTGITPAVPASTNGCYPAHKGGGTSHTYFNRGEIQGFQHPSRQPCHIRGLAGVAAGVFEHPGGALFISGTRATEIELRETSIAIFEEVAVHIHECRNFSFDGYVECNAALSGQTGRGGRVIFSPSAAENVHSLAGFAAAGTLRPVWVHRGSTINDGTLDTRPSLPFISATDFTDGADVGFMESFYLTADLDPGMNGNISEGLAMIAPPGKRAGLGSRNPGAPPFFDPATTNINWALYVDGDTGLLAGEGIQATPVDVTVGRLMRADYGYSPGNLLDTVTEAAGVPTGGVVERGSNANGEFVRFADGTQVCTAIVTGVDINLVGGSIFRSASVSQTFAAAFATVPTGSGSVGSTVNAWVNGRASSGTQWDFAAFSYFSQTNATIYLTAVGRWF